MVQKLGPAAKDSAVLPLEPYAVLNFVQVGPLKLFLTTVQVFHTSLDARPVRFNMIRRCTVSPLADYTDCNAHDLPTDVAAAKRR
jgi:hypothetical protein